jgi:hypothetical protein
MPERPGRLCAGAALRSRGPSRTVRRRLRLTQTSSWKEGYVWACRWFRWSAFRARCLAMTSCATGFDLELGKIRSCRSPPRQKMPRSPRHRSQLPRPESLACSRLWSLRGQRVPARFPVCTELVIRVKRVDRHKRPVTPQHLQHRARKLRSVAQGNGHPGVRRARPSKAVARVAPLTWRSFPRCTKSSQTRSRVQAGR